MTKTTENPSNRFWASIKHRCAHEGTLIGLILVAGYLGLALFGYSAHDPGFTYAGHNSDVRNIMGPSGAWIANVLISAIGVLAYVVPVWAVVRASILFRERRKQYEWHWGLFALRWIGGLLVMLSGAGLAALHFQFEGTMSAGGFIGLWVSELLFFQLNLLGTTLVLFALFIFSLTVAFHVSWLRVMDNTGDLTLRFFAWVKAKIHLYRVGRSEQKQTKAFLETRKANLEISIEKQSERKPPTIRAPKMKPADSPSPKVQQQSLFDNRSLGQLPSIDLLDRADSKRKMGYDKATLEAMSRMLEIKLKDFGVDAEVVAVAPGPVITRFEIQPAPGIKVSKISNIAKDLARSMAMVSVRVVEIIPGKTVVGIEVPNENRGMVMLSEILSSKAYQDAPSPVALGLGHDIGGSPVVVDLAKMPHLLVAGTTGSGKSVGVNSMLISMLYKATPEQVRLILVDPKMLELSIYEGIPHLLTPVITDMKDAANGLRWCVGEMERRYKLMASVGVRNLAGYNKKVLDAEKAGAPIKDPLWKAEDHLDTENIPDLGTLPVIVVVIDEFADMMMVVGKKVEELIARLAQKARAAGIHLILATQRPSVDVITGLIKANIPTRIAFQVSSKIDSRTILDQGGAESLLGNGDMLYMPPGTSLPERVHGAFVSDDEVHAVVSEWKLRGQPNYISEITDGTSDDGSSGMGGFSEDSDEGDVLFDEAVAFVTETRKASISSVQRKFRIGYNRAARLVETMENAGVVSAAGHNGAREVLAPPPPRP